MYAKTIQACFLILVAAVPAFGADIVSVTNNEELVTLAGGDVTRGKFRLNETLCLFRNREELACGFVGRLADGEITVKITTRARRVSPGDQVVLRRETRYPSSVESTEAVTVKKRPVLDASLGMDIGFDYFFPKLQLQLAVGKRWSLGVTGNYMKFTQAGFDVKGLGVFGTIAYYYTHFPFRGFFVQAAGGFYKFELTNTVGTTEISPFAGQLTLEWRGKAHWALGVDLGIGLGVQYVQDLVSQTAATSKSDFRGILPLLRGFIAYSF